MAARVPSRVVAGALLVRLIDEWWSYLPAGIVEDLHRDLGLSYERAGWLLGVLFITGLVTSPLEVLADHVDRRATAVSGGLLLTVSLLVFAWGGSFSVLVAACVAMGVADSLLVGPLEAALAEEPPQHLDRLLAVQHALSFGGDLIGPLLLGIGAATVLGWRFAFVATALATLAFTAFVAATPLPGPAPAVQGDGPATRHGLLAVVARPDVLLLVVVEVLLGSLDEPLLAFVVARTAGELSTRGPEQLLAGAVMVGGLAGSLVIARVGGASLVRRVGPWLLALGAAVSAVPAGIVVGVVAMAAVGLGMAMVWAGVHHRMLTIVPGRVGTVSALSSIVGALGVGAPVLGGALADRFGLTVALAAFSALAVLVALLVPVVVPERGGGRRRREGRRHRGPGFARLVTDAVVRHLGKGGAC